VLTLLGTIVFATVVGIGSLDSRSGLSLFGKYTAPDLAGLRPRPSSGGRRGGDGRADPR
jgi:hypothetical protein